MTDKRKLDQTLTELHQVCAEILIPDGNLLSFIYSRIRLLTDNDPSSLSLLQLPRLFTLTRPFMANRDQEIRTTALRVFRYLMISEASFVLLLSIHIEHFLIRSFETEGKSQERIESCKLVRRWLELSPLTFPKGLCNSLVALSESDLDEFKEFGLEALRLLSISGSFLVAWSGGLRVLILSLLDIKSSQELTENIIYTICYLLNEAETRVYLKGGRDLMRILAVFTEDSPHAKENELEVAIKLARRAVTLISRSWSGLIFLASTGLRAVINTLTLPTKSLVKEGILDTVIDMLNIPIEYGAKSYNLLNNYLAILIKALLHCDLYKALAALSLDDSPRISTRARKLLRLITKISSELLPDAPLFPLSLLRSAPGKGFEVVAELDSSSRRPALAKESSFIYTAACFVATNCGGALAPPPSLFTSICGQYMSNNLDELQFASLIAKTQVSKESSKWVWEDIYGVLAGLRAFPERIENLYSQKFLQTLVMYFTHSKGVFVNLPWSPENFVIAQTGTLMLMVVLAKKAVRAMLTTPYSESYFVMRKSFVEEMLDSVELEIKFARKKKKSENRVFTPAAVLDTMAREYLKWLALLVNHGFGVKLLRSLNFLAKLMSLSEIEHISVILLPVLDYKKELPQQFLTFCLQARSKLTKHKAISQLQAVFRAGILDLSWAIWGIVNLLYMPDSDTVTFAVSVLNELCKSEDNLKALIETRPQSLVKLGEQGEICLRKFLSSTEGTQYLCELGFLDSQLTLWHTSRNTEYARYIEVKIEQGLNPQRKIYALVLTSPKIFENYDSLQISWISSLPLNVLVQASSSSLVAKMCLEVEQDEVYLVSYLSEYGLERGEGIIAVSLKLAGSFLDNRGEKIAEPLWIKCRNEGSEEGKEQKWQVEHEGVIFCFGREGNSGGCRLDEVKYRVQVVPNESVSMHIPMHLFGELVKTELGMKMLGDRGYLEEYMKKLDEKHSIIEKRSCLWALGHVGASAMGAAYLIKLGAVQKIVTIAETSLTLSLRGTAVQTLSLISRSSLGRAELNRYSWISSHHGYNSIAIPANPDVIFWLEQADMEYPFLQKSIEVERILENTELNEQETEIYSNICKLGGVLDKSANETFLRGLRFNSPLSFQSLKLFHAIMVTISAYSFKLPVRRAIHKLLERVYRIENLEVMDQLEYIT